MKNVTWIMIACAFAFCAQVQAQQTGPAVQQRIVWGGKDIQLDIDRTTGNLLQVRVKNIEVIGLTGVPATDVEIEGRPWLQSGKPVLARVDSTRQLNCFTLRVHQTVAGSSDTIITSYLRYPGQHRLERSIVFKTGASGRKRKFNGFRFSWPGLRIGAAEDCIVDVPGPFWPFNFTVPGSPYRSLLQKTTAYHSAPDGGFGIFSLTNQSLRLSLTSFIKTNGTRNYFTSVKGQGAAISLMQNTNHSVYLEQGELLSDTQCLLATDSFATALATYQAEAAARMPLPAYTPAWVKEAVILEVLPEYFKGGFREIASRLPFFRQVGFNTLYLMPHWVGGYSPVDLYQVNPEYGSEQDLQQLVREAHRLGMKVLFDMVIHGFNKKSPVIQQRPEFFYRDADTLVIHPAWGSVMTDFMDSSYRKYMKECVLRDQQVYGIDGYRVDAASFKGPNWDTAINYPAYSSGTASPALMEIMLSALRQKNKDAALLSEVFGPVFYTVSNFGHDNQTEAMSFLIREMEKKNYHVDLYKKHVQYVYGSLPPGAVRVFYSRNHDTSWFYDFFGYSRLFMSLEAIHALFGVPEVFAGDPNYRFNPDDDPATYAHYKKLFAARRQYPEFVHGKKLLDQVHADQADVFAGLVQDSSHTSLALVSASPSAIPVQVSLQRGVGVSSSLRGYDIISQRKLPVKLQGRTLSATLEPYQVLIVRLR